MARYTGPKVRLMRKEGVDLGLKSASKLSATKRINTPPGVHGPKGKGKLSSYGIQLREKQKVKVIYGMLEKQLVRFYGMAAKSKGNTGIKFLELLERRLDNAVYKLGFAPTRASARQLVNHGHVKINDKRVSIPSYIVETGEVISLNDKALEMPVVKETLNLTKDSSMPEWLEKKGAVGKIAGLPIRDDSPSIINESLIVEYYSR